MSDLSAYIHVPFCRRKCNYCDFYSAPPTDGAVSSYVRALCGQIRLSRAKGSALKTVYFGGGTPSLLSARDFERVSECLRETFDLSSCEEFTVECNPESVTLPLAEVWLRCGVDRVSMGIQSFSDDHLSRLGRLHDGKTAEDAFEILRRAGFGNISVDLMAALPGQTEEEFRTDLSRVLALGPEHVSVYLLKIEENSPFGLAKIAEADEELQRSLYLAAHRRLTEGGYEHYEISNFARPGYRSRHNSVYWTGGEYLAFGPGASGYYRSVRYRIPADTDGFCRSCGAVPEIVEETVDREEAEREAIFLGLRLSDGIDRNLIRSGKLPFAETLCRQGLAVLTENRFALTAEGFLVSDYVISELMPDK